MAYFAKLGTGNIVEEVVSVNNSVITDSNGIEREQLGINFLNKTYNTQNIWKQTSYNKTFRKNFAGIGYTYDDTRSAFIPPKPFNSWILNENSCIWEAPVTIPSDYEDKLYNWDESSLSWKE